MSIIKNKKETTNLLKMLGVDNETALTLIKILEYQAYKPTLDALLSAIEKVKRGTLETVNVPLHLDLKPVEEKVDLTIPGVAFVTGSTWSNIRFQFRNEMLHYTQSLHEAYNLMSLPEITDTKKNLVNDILDNLEKKVKHRLEEITKNYES